MGETDRLLRVLRQVREKCHVSQEQIDAHMQKSIGTYRHIEAGRRSLPNPLEESDEESALAIWLNDFIKCVKPSEEDKELIWSTARRVTLERFAAALRKLERGK